MDYIAFFLYFYDIKYWLVSAFLAYVLLCKKWTFLSLAGQLFQMQEEGVKSIIWHMEVGGGRGEFHIFLVPEGSIKHQITPTLGFTANSLKGSASDRTGLQFCNFQVLKPTFRVAVAVLTLTLNFYLNLKSTYPYMFVRKSSNTVGV